MVALFPNFRRFLLKAGIEIRGTYTTIEDIDCNDAYIASVNLLNRKDRAVTVYSIYLKLGYACYVELQDFEENPLILKPFESYTSEYEPLQMYVANGKWVQLDALIKDKKIKKSLYVSTSEGKHKVIQPKRVWNPISEYFANYSTVMASPIRCTYKNKSFKPTVKYVVELKLEEGKEEVFAIYKQGFEKQYKKFRLTEYSLQSKENLKQFFEDYSKNAEPKIESIRIHDLDEWREQKLSDYDLSSPVIVHNPNWFRYFIISKIASTYLNIRTASKNRQLFKNYQKGLSKQHKEDEN